MSAMSAMPADIRPAHLAKGVLEGLHDGLEDIQAAVVRHDAPEVQAGAGRHLEPQRQRLRLGAHPLAHLRAHTRLPEAKSLVKVSCQWQTCVLSESWYVEGLRRPQPDAPITTATASTNTPLRTCRLHPVCNTFWNSKIGQ